MCTPCPFHCERQESPLYVGDTEGQDAKAFLAIPERCPITVLTLLGAACAYEETINGPDAVLHYPVRGEGAKRVTDFG